MVLYDITKLLCASPHLAVLEARYMVSEVGFEPTRPFGDQKLSLLYGKLGHWKERTAIAT